LLNASKAYKHDFRDFKEFIDLIQYAASFGYDLDQKKSTVHQTVMHLDRVDKIIVSRRNGIWIYFSVYDDNDNGTIIDFVKNRTDQSYLEIAQTLHDWSGEPSVINKIRRVSCDNKSSYEPLRIHRIFNRCATLIRHRYLQKRGIQPSFLKSSRFFGRIFQDDFGNAVFPHFKQRLVCGLELRNQDIDLFIKGSEKSFWRSNVFKDDTTLFIAESPIDAMSYEVLFAPKNGFYLATCGGFSKKQQLILEEFIKQLSNTYSITVITDHDQGGHRIANKVIQVLETMNFKGAIQRHSPSEIGKDWNDILIEKLGLLMSSGGCTAERLSKYASGPRCMEP